MNKEKEVSVHINNISFFGDHYEIIDFWMKHYGDSFINKENLAKAKNKKYHLFNDKNRSEWKFVNQQKYGYLLAKDYDGCIKGIVEEDENVAKTNAASEIFTIRKEVNKKKRKTNSISNGLTTTFASYIETCKKTYTKSEYDESRTCPMHKPFCVHACEFYDKSNNGCGFICPNLEYYGNCSRCSHSYRLKFTDRDLEMCGYGIVKIIKNS